MNEWTVDVDRRIYKGIEVGMLRDFIKERDPIVIVTGKLLPGSTMFDKCKQKWDWPGNATYYRHGTMRKSQKKENSDITFRTQQK